MTQLEIRRQALSHWLASVLPGSVGLLPMISGAGTRRYWRAIVDNKSFVVMESATDEKFKIFIALSHTFSSAGVWVPQIIAADEDQGFLLLTDFGEDLYEKILSIDNADHLYPLAFESLLQIQRLPLLQIYDLPPFDMRHYREKMEWFIEFYLQRLLKYPLDLWRLRRCHALFDLLIETVQQQPYVGVHYDYHCRNLCLLTHGKTGVLDFQDTVQGPVTYDLMALLRDSYIDWPSAKVMQWQEQFRQMVQDAGIIAPVDPEVWNRWCDFSSAQRHIKNIGLFARFHILKLHSSYLDYIPRILGYLREISQRHSEMKDFQILLEEIS
jgi:aminoglycoside/choline kinase family phosphotransferase